MRKYLFALALAVTTLLSVTAANTQTLSNPDISAVGDMRYHFRTGEAADGLGVNKTEFEFRELELNFNAYLNPYMRADIYIGIHGTEGPVDVEEASMTVLRGLPLALQLKGGKYLLDFGKINQMHPHQFGWLEFPLMIQTNFGEEGLRTVGMQLSTLFALGDNAVTLAGNAFSSAAFAHDHAHGDHEQAEEESPPEIMGSARLSWFRAFTDFLTGEAGVSGVYGTFDSVESLKKRIAGADLLIRWRPNNRRAFIWRVELMYGDNDVALADPTDTTGTAEPIIERITAPGAFTNVEYQFAQRFDAGVYYDWAEIALVRDAEATAWGGYVGFMPVEETARFSLVYRRETSDLYDFTDDTITLQFLWALGPHQPHRI